MKAAIWWYALCTFSQSLASCILPALAVGKTTLPFAIVAGAVVRVEVAALREELMVKKLATAEELHSHQDEVIASLEAARGGTLLAVSCRLHSAQAAVYICLGHCKSASSHV